jgi:hypothetical protein
MQATDNIVKLRHLLAERFPRLRQGLSAPSLPEMIETGIASLDALLGGGLPRGEFTEVIGVRAGSAQVVHALLRRVAVGGKFVVLVDGADSFDVGAVGPEVLTRLLWVRCDSAGAALKAADLLLRDRNFPLVIIDLKLNPVGQLRKIQTTTWYRFGRLLEQNRATVLVVTPFPLVSGAACSVRIEGGLGLDSLARPPADLLARLKFTLLRSSTAEVGERSSRAG